MTASSVLPSDRVYQDPYRRCLTPARAEAAWDYVWTIGGVRGWYADWLWDVRGWLDRLVGGPGMRRGRRSPTDLQPGDPLDCWRVLVADQPGYHLLLRAEMRMPGTAWLEYRLDRSGSRCCLAQTVYFKPHGWWGKLYWWSAYPLHRWVFAGTLRRIVRSARASVTTSAVVS